MDSSAHHAESDLRALLDGELPSAQRQEVEQHLGACSVCRARLASLESAAEETAALLNVLPSASPDLRIEAIVARARRPRLRWGAIAAVLALFVATVAGATVGRPYVRALVEQIRAVVRSVPPPPPPAPPQLPTAPPGQLGVAFVPGPQTEISFDAPQSAGAVRVLLADSAKLVIAPTAAVTYRIYSGGVIVHNRGSAANYDVLVPLRARHVRILVAGRVLFEKTGSSITGPYVFGLR